MFITNISHHSEFIHVAEDLNNLQIKYETIRDDAYLVRMEMIGICEDYKRQFKQRSAEANYIQKGYDKNKWSETTVYRSYAVYRLRKELLSNVNPEICDVAQLANYSQLAELSGDNSKATIYHAAMHLKKYGDLPTVKELRGHKAGFFDDCFVSKAALAAANKAKTDDSPEVQPGNFPVETLNTPSSTSSAPAMSSIPTAVCVPMAPQRDEVSPQAIPKVAHQGATALKLKSSLKDVDGFTLPMCDEVRSLIQQLYART